MFGVQKGTQPSRVSGFDFVHARKGISQLATLPKKTFGAQDGIKELESVLKVNFTANIGPVEPVEAS